MDPDRQADGVRPGPAGAPGEAAERLEYRFKPSLLGALWSFTLTADALIWRHGRREAVFPLDEIARLRLTYRPQSLQARRYRTDIIMTDGRRVALISVTWRAMLALTPQSRDYTAFVRALHQRLVARGSKAIGFCGLARPLYLAGLFGLGLIALAMLVLAIGALAQGYLSGAGFIVAFLALGGWQLGTYFWRNRPRTYRLDAVPDELVPPSGAAQ